MISLAGTSPSAHDRHREQRRQKACSCLYRLQSSAEVTAPASWPWQELASTTHSGHNRDCVHQQQAGQQGHHYPRTGRRNQQVFMTSTPNQPICKNLGRWARRTCAQMWGPRSDQEPTGLLHPQLLSNQGGMKRVKCCRGCTYPGTSLTDSMYKQEEVWLGEKHTQP